MAWVAGENVTTGQLINAARWNNYLGASGDIDLLKVETDKLDDVSQATPARTSGTIYQNDSGKIRIVSATAYADNAGEGGLLKAEVKSTSPPDTYIVADEMDQDIGIKRGCITFVVPVNWYYRITAPAGTVLSVAEWDLH